MFVVSSMTSVIVKRIEVTRKKEPKTKKKKHSIKKKKKKMKEKRKREIFFVVIDSLFRAENNLNIFV